ncbi:type I-C CRISPR-associated protein Cas8c/Csd1 [Novisyntrophococcus fermenticellae]|uniref:type I-C CRISPR-associated protein Cas8c/Csd1 n=1 Tax=Novisyntrophococcus fermenticellae TaxID=2068655 RepID=UPI001E5DEB5C|nr:type I-C CRISPR-associated protein Cas8c/Csd1 [Novisyntrophococcus fermenticellae]
MSVLTALYKTYLTAIENNLVDRTEYLGQKTLLLPVYHSSKKSTGSNDMIEVMLSENAEFIKAAWVPKDQLVIYPVTEESIIRAGKVISPHPLCEELPYLSKEMNPEKHEKYEQVREEWVAYMRNGHPNRLLEIVDQYLLKEHIFYDCIESLYAGVEHEIIKDYKIHILKDGKTSKTVSLEKTFVTFRVELAESTEADLTVSTNKELHKNYIDYVREKNSVYPQEQCDISGEMTYCVSRHRGLLGNAKLISISNHNETYYGRFESGEEVVHIGYETSQMIHLMLKYLLENKQNKKQIGATSFLVNWFSDDIGNEECSNLLDNFSPEKAATLNDTKIPALDEDDDIPEHDTDKPNDLGGFGSSVINDYLSGKQVKIDPNGKFYIMILDKISNGRISIKYFHEMPKSDLLLRAGNWYQQTNWNFYYRDYGMVRETPSLFRYVDTVFGLENKKGYMECKNAKLRTKTVERLLPCILEQRQMPMDIKNRMLENLCNRNSYDKTWNYVLAVGCSIFKKYKIDKKEEVNEMLDETKQKRSYLFGRLLAVYEKLEKDVLVAKDLKKPDDSDSKEKKGVRPTNAERLWSAYAKRPERTLKILEDKVRPYRDIFSKNNARRAIYYDGIIMKIACLIRESNTYEKDKNKALDEDFVFGYYAQKQEFYNSKNKKQENMNVEDMDNGSITE